MGELNKAFKPETMRLFVKLEEDGKYHEVEGLSEFDIEQEGGYFSPVETTFTISGVNTNVSDDAVTIEKEQRVKPPKVGYVSVNGFNTFSADALIFNELDKVIGFKLLSKRDRYRGHLPKKVIVSGPCVISFWHDGTKTISRCHDGDEMDVRTGIMLNAIKKWMPGGTYWQGVMDDVEVEYQAKKERAEKPSLAPLEPINHYKPCRPYMRGGKYGDDEKLSVIQDVESGMSQQEVSRKYGIGQSTISRWMSQWRGDE